MFKDELKRIRLLAFFTQKELCVRSGIPLGTYKSWELGLQYPAPRNWKVYIEFMKQMLSSSQLSEIQRLYVERSGEHARATTD